METLLQDIRLVSTTHKTTRFAALAITSMALGIGANTSIFSLVDTAFAAAACGEGASQLVELYGTLHTARNGRSSRIRIMKVTAIGNRLLGSVGLSRLWSVVHSQQLQPARLGISCFRKLFRCFGVKPMLGRAFLPEEDQSADSHPLRN